MADIADNADEINELHLQESLAAQKRRAIELKPKGICHYCDEGISSSANNKLFCDTDCRDDYDKYKLGARR